MSLRPQGKRVVATWLFACAGFVLAMVVVGGITRLTRSGLSIVEWNPIAGALPPMSESDWQQAFAAYQRSPEGQLVNTGMDLDGFKQIFLVEWIHRLLGRVTGVVVLVPLVWFAITRRLSSKRVFGIAGIFAMGALQGFLGWFMVKSGLNNDPHVSPFRLTLHLGMALVIFSLLLWNALDETGAFSASGVRWSTASSPIRPFAWATLALVAVTIAYGGLMAGMHAGLLAPTFPDVNGSYAPDGMFANEPWYANFVDNALTVHVVHRILAGCVALGSVVTFVAAQVLRTSRAARVASSLLVGAVAMQITLGALTVLNHVPIALAALHQLNGALLLGAAVALVFTVRRSR